MNVMKRAWEIAREAVKKFGGKVKEYFANALKLAWKEVKQVSIMTVQKLKEEIKNAYGAGFAHREIEISFKEWKINSPLHRLYINVESKNKLNTLYISLKGGKVSFDYKNETFKNFGQKVATIVENNKEFILSTFIR